MRYHDPVKFVGIPQGQTLSIYLFHTYNTVVNSNVKEDIWKGSDPCMS